MPLVNETQPAYVVANDKFMSGWGDAANKKNWFAVECYSPDQVDTILKAMDDRKEMTYVRVLYEKPRDTAKVVVSLRRFDQLGGAWKGKN